MWNDLTMSERAGVIKMAVKAGLRDMKSIRDFYDNSLKYADGGSINISPSKRGTFTAAATKHGMGVQEFASKVLANKDNYSPAMVKKANFAKNASKWKHDLGGYLFEEGGPKATYGKPYYSYDKNMQIETDNGKPILNYSATLPEVNIIPDSKKSPADRNADERFRQKTFSDYAEHKDRGYTQRQIAKSQNEWNNSTEKKVLQYGQGIASGIGIVSDMLSGYPVYSTLKGERVLSKAKTPMDYAEAGLWLLPAGVMYGKGIRNLIKTGANKEAAWIASQKIHGYPTDVELPGLGDFAADVETGLSQEAKEGLRRSTIERNINELNGTYGANSGYGEYYKIKAEEAMDNVRVGRYSQKDYDIAGKNGTEGFFSPIRRFISINKGSLDPLKVEKHEGRHLIDEVLEDLRTDKQRQIMKEAYGDDFINLPKTKQGAFLGDYTGMENEIVTTNRDARDLVIDRFRKQHDYEGDLDFIQENKIIDATKDNVISDALEYSNGYGYAFINFLKDSKKLTPERIQKLKETMKHVGGVAAPIAIGTALGNQYAGGGQLPKYLERPEEYSLRPFTIVSKTPKKEIKGNWEVEKNVLLPEIVVTGKAPYRELEVQDIKDNKYIKEQYEKDALQALKGKSKSEVKAIQKQLADSGAYDLNADNLSEKEIKNIQRKIGAKEDGIWGKESANKWRKYNIDGVVGNRTLDAIGKFNNKQNWSRDVPTENTEWCAEWVYNKVMDATGQNYGVYGDAWKMPKNIVDNGGTEIYNIYDSSFSKVKDVESLKKKTKEAISKNPFDVKTLQVGDIVGIYMPSSNMHETAMKEGSTFNTHIGVVTGFNSKGIPIIEHNIHRKHHKDLATNITGSLEGKPQITTVTRPAYEEMHTPFNTDSIESKYVKKSDAQPFKDFANSVAGSKELLSKVFNNIDAEEVERITLAVQGRETGFMKNRSSDQKGISGVKESAKKFYRDSIAKKDPMTVSSNLAKTKLSSFTAQERNLLNIHKPSDLEDPKLAGRAAAYLIAKNYDYFVRLKNKYPNLGITMDDVRYLTELSYNQGMRKLKNIGFKDGVKALEELGAIRKMADANAKVKDISATNYSHLGLLGKFIYDTFGEGHTPYISAAEKYRQKLIETKEKNN